MIHPNLAGKEGSCACRNITGLPYMPKSPLLPLPLDHAVFEFFDSLSEAVFLMNPKGTVLEANSIFAERFGKHPTECVGINAFEMMSSGTNRPDMAATWKTRVEKVLCQDKQLVFKDKQGEKILHTTIHPVNSGDVDITCLLVSIRDITEQKGSLRQQHQACLFRELIDVLPGFVFIMDSDGRMISWNHYTRDIILGRNETEMYGTCALVNIHPDDRPLLKEKFLDVLKLDSEQTVEARVKFHDRMEYVLLMLTGRKIVIDGKNSVLAVGVDLTERNRYENSLNKKNTKFNQALEAALAGVWEWNLSTNENIWSDEIWPLYGLKKGETPPSFELWSSTIHPEDREMAIRTMTEAAKNESDLNLEYRVYSLDGSTRWLMVRGKPLHDNISNAASYIGTVIDITERKKLLEQLRNSETKYHSLFENIPKGIAYCRMIYEEGSLADFVYLDVNPAFESLTGLVNVIGKRMSEVFPGVQHSYEELFQIYRRVAQSGKSEQLEYYVEALNQWHSISVASPERDYFIAIFDVITEQKKAEKEILEDKAKLEAALASMTDAVFFSDTEGRLIDFNEAFATFHRFKSKQECSRNFSEYPEFLEVFMENGEPAPVNQWAVPRALRGETAMHAEYTMRRKDTGETWVGSYGFAPIHDDDGKIVGSVVTGRDITDQKLTENALRESEIKFRSIFDHSPVAIGIGDFDQARLLEVNASWLRFFGYSRQEVLGRTLATLRLFRDIEDHKTIVKIFKEQGRVVNRHVQLRKKSGELMNILLSAENISMNGRPCILVMMMDITQGKRAEEEQERLQAQLLQSQKMELIGQLAGGIAHDFNNVLAAILGNAELLLEQVEESNPLINHIKDIHKSAIRSIDLTRQLLAFARKQTTQPKVLSLNSEVETLLPMLRRLIGESIRIHWHPDSCNTFVRADPSQLDQILTNLSVNARDAIKESGTIIIETGTVHVGQSDCAEGHPCQSPGDYVRLSITDSGSGIDTNTLPHIFEPFFTTKEIGKGTGLGLSTVYGIIKQNNGYLDCRTEQEKGTTFSIYLPRLQEPRKKTVSDVSGPIQQQPTGQTILLVEDEPQLLNLTRRILENKGFTVLAALDADTAISLAENHGNHIDLLVTDITLPKMNGVLLSEKIHFDNPETSVLFMSGYTSGTIAQGDQGDVRNNFISKPFTIKDFLGAVYRSLSSSSAPLAGKTS
jgi:PAS domain S-box-containing protein